jgi:triosephosphate isomerase
MPKLFFANWKMYLSDDEAVALAGVYAETSRSAGCEVAVAPTFTALERVAEALKGGPVALGAQDAFWEEKGAYTGEVSVPMLAALGVRYVILGHSERRAHFGETDEIVAKKAKAVSAHGLVPVICVGETAEEKAAGRREEIVLAQLKAAEGLSAELVVAYEPRWAIGTGVACAPEDAFSVLKAIRATVGAGTRVLYGGSVDAANLGGFIVDDGFDGVLVGGASAKREQVAGMIAVFS